LGIKASRKYGRTKKLFQLLIHLSSWGTTVKSKKGTANLETREKESVVKRGVKKEWGM